LQGDDAVSGVKVDGVVVFVAARDVAKRGDGFFNERA